MKARITVLPGDGIGVEVIAEARRVLAHVASKHGHELQFEEHMIGGIAIDATGTALPPETLEACQAADAVLLGAVGGPKWSDPTAPVRPEQGLLGLRKALEVYANLRPVQVHPDLIDASPLRPERLRGVDIVVVRELTGGLYFGARGREPTSDGGQRVFDTLVYTDREIRRIVRLAFNLARGRRKKLTSVDKANVLESSRLWRQIAVEVHAEFPDVELDHQLVDAAAMRLITSAATFDVMVTENMFGDILTDEASVLAGSLGMLPSASLGDTKRGLYEPCHGSAPDIAGKGIANPIGAILSGAMMFRYSLGWNSEATELERAVDHALSAGARTKDLGGDLGTEQMGSAILEQLDAARVR